MTTTHTPGPWYVYGPAAECVATDALGERGILVAKTSLLGTDYQADARLIAAAPELLETLRETLEWITTSVPPGTDGLTSIVHEIEDAIARAEGRS